MKKCNVIIMDDDSDDVYMLSNVMRKTGKFNVVATGSSEKGLVTALENSADYPDAIVCDLNIPPSNGIKIHHNLRALDDYASIPFILISGIQPPKLIKEAAMNEGLFSILLKPDTFSGYYKLCDDILNFVTVQSAHEC